MNKIKEFFTSTLFKRFCWNTLAGLLAVVVAYLSGFQVSGNEAILIALGVAVINNLTKEINDYVSTQYAK